MPRTPPPEPEYDANPAAWDRWNARQRRNEAARQRRADRRDRLAYPADGTPLVAEASCEGTFFRPPPLPPSVLRVSVRLRAPQSFAPSDRSLSFGGPASLEDLPLSWRVRDWLWQRLPSIAYGGLGSVLHPWPKGAFDIEFTRIEVVPPLEPSNSLEEIGRFAEAFAGTVQGALRIAFGGMVAYNQQPQFIQAPSLEPEWYLERRNMFGEGTVTRGRPFASREEAEAALKDASSAAEATVVLVRDVLSHADLSRDDPPDEEVRYGDGTLSPAETAELKLNDWILHLGLKRLLRVRGIRLDAPGGPLINAGRGWEHYTFFRLPRERDTT